MRQRKNYKTKSVAVASELGAASQIPWVIRARTTPCDFRRWLYVGRPLLSGDGVPPSGAIDAQRPRMVDQVRNSVWIHVNSGMRQATVLNLCASGLANWFEFLDDQLDLGRPVSAVEDIDPDLMQTYVGWLLRKPGRRKGSLLSYTSAKAIYGATKTVLIQCVAAGTLSRHVFPLNPFPDAERAYVGHQPMSRTELHQLIASLADELRAIRNGSFDGSFLDKLCVYFLLIAIRTGRNLTPLLELDRSALQPHPLKPEFALLRVYKRRGTKVHVQAFKRFDTNEDLGTVPADVATLYAEAAKLTADIAKQAPAALRDQVWLYRRHDSIHALQPGTVFGYCRRVVEKHGLTSDQRSGDGSEIPLTVNVGRLRATFATRVWQLSGGDLYRTAKLLGNTPQVADTHYLDVTPDIKRNHKFVGQILAANMLGTVDDPTFRETLATQLGIAVTDVPPLLSGDRNTGVGRCSDYLYGRFAPKNGTTSCSRFLHCFRCPNQVILESDLYRLFSFYWLMLKERAMLGRSNWKAVYGWVVREIDEVIAIRFPLAVVNDAKERARSDPHPLWRDRAMLSGGSVE